MWCILRHSYRHTENMIKKLESAGLGFYVKYTETQDRLGMVHCSILKHVHVY